MQNVEKLYLTEIEAAHRYGYSVQWFQRERWKKTGPRFIKINNGKVRYPLKETDEWFASFDSDSSAK